MASKVKDAVVWYQKKVRGVLFVFAQLCFLIQKQRKFLFWISFVFYYKSADQGWGLKTFSHLVKEICCSREICIRNLSSTKLWCLCPEVIWVKQYALFLDHSRLSEYDLDFRILVSLASAFMRKAKMFQAVQLSLTPAGVVCPLIPWSQISDILLDSCTALPAALSLHSHLHLCL